MTVKQLIESLKCFPWEAPVILAKDAEGNGFSPLPDERGISCEKYEADNAWSGSLGDSDNGMDVNAVVLWPTN